MKKFLSVLLATSMLAGVLVGCGGNKDTVESEQPSTPVSEQPTTPVSEQPAAGGSYKLGMGVVVSDSSKEGTAQVDSTVAAVILDEAGKILSCYIDVAQNKMSIAGGTATAGQTYLTKQELKDDYGMRKASGIGKEWFEQADFFANYVVGKTADEVAAIETEEVNNHNIATDADILAGCTMSIPDMIEAVVKACNDDMAKSFNAETAPVLGVAIETEDSSTKDPADDKAGTAAMYTTFGVTATVNGVVAAAVVDTIQPKISFGTDGVPTEFGFGGTKRELKEDYGMKKASSIEKEWYEQSGFLTDYVVGKTADEIGAIETVENNGHFVATDADILAGCTMSIDGYLSVLSKAASK